MSAPDELAEMKRYELKYFAYEGLACTGFDNNPINTLDNDETIEVYVRADADRVIAARDAENAQLLKNCQRYIELLDSVQAMLLDMTQRADAAQAEIAARDARIAELSDGLGAVDTALMAHLEVTEDGGSDAAIRNTVRSVQKLVAALASRDARIAELEENLSDANATIRRNNGVAVKALAYRDAEILALSASKFAARIESKADLQKRITTLTERLASRDAEIAEAREVLRNVADISTATLHDPGSDLAWILAGLIQQARAILTPSNVPAEPSGGRK